MISLPPIQHILLRHIQEKQLIPVRVMLLKPSAALFKASMEHRTTSERRELEGGNPAGAVIELNQALPGRNQVDVTSQDC